MIFGPLAQDTIGAGTRTDYFFLSIPFTIAVLYLSIEEHRPVCTHENSFAESILSSSFVHMYLLTWYEINLHISLGFEFPTLSVKKL